MTPNRAHIETIKRLYEEHPPEYDGSWLNVANNPSFSFLICVGAGPWKENRRRTVQEKALLWLWSPTGLKSIEDADLSIATIESCANAFPLEWQNKFLTNMVRALHERKDFFYSVCDLWRIDAGHKLGGWRLVASDLFEMCGAPKNGSKVLWMFLRDFLEIPAFAVDRWVMRNLKKNDLPTNPWTLIELCLEAKVSPNELSRGLFTARE